MLKATLRIYTGVIALCAFSIAHADDFKDKLEAEIQAQLDQSIVINLDDIPLPEINIKTDPSEVWHYQSLEREEECLAKNIYWESWREPEKGQVAVGLVTINRLKTGQYADTICGVVYQKGKNHHHKWVAQFSWVLKRVHTKIPRNLPAWEHAQEIARNLLQGGNLDNVNDFTNGCTYYHAVYVKRRAARRFDVYEPIMRIGLHIFFRDPTQASLASRY